MFSINFSGVLLLSIFFSVCCGNESLEFDSNRRLSRNSILHKDTAYCRNKIDSAWKSSNPHWDARNLVAMNESMLESFVLSGVADDMSVKCIAVCVDIGLAEDLVPYPIPNAMYSEASALESNPSDLASFVDNCKKAEVGFISYYPKEAKLYWLNNNNKRHEMGLLKYGERNTMWQRSYLGHTFEVCDKDTDELLLRHTVMYNAHVVVGQDYQIEAVNRSIHNTFNFEQVNAKVKQAMSHEWTRCNRVKRTFTPLGFSKGRVPKDVWGSISAYQYNNRDNVFVEEWSSGGKGYFVNWWEVTPYMIGIPWNLKRYWQSRLREMVEAWIGGNIPLENTDIYGIRRYEDGARLLTHVDRESTHAVSMIINVDQVAMREPWMVEIYDFAGRLHEIEMHPGDIVYYESARCLHGRMQPLKGASYSNLFTHYRPVGDPQWFTRSNEKDTPEQILSIDHCDKEDGIVNCDGIQLPYLSPSNEVVAGPNDLYSYWERIGLAERSKSQSTSSARRDEL